MKLLTKLFFTILTVSCFYTQSFATDFKEEIGKLGLVLSTPKDYIVVAPEANEDMEYDYAIKHTKKKYEVRFALRPISEEMKKDYKEYLKNKGKDKSRIVIDPNSMFDSEFQAVTLNIAGSGSATYPQPFDPKSVQSEYGADSGLNTYVQGMTSEFAGEYKNCLMVGIHKTDVGQFYIFHLFDNYEDVEDLTEETFYSLKYMDPRK